MHFEYVKGFIASYEWVSSFLMAHHHKQGYLVPFKVYTIDEIWKNLQEGKTYECKIKAIELQ